MWDRVPTRRLRAEPGSYFSPAALDRGDELPWQFQHHRLDAVKVRVILRQAEDAAIELAMPSGCLCRM